MFPTSIRRGYFVRFGIEVMISYVLHFLCAQMMSKLLEREAFRFDGRVLLLSELIFVAKKAQAQ